jgi:hypothetical protein
MDRQFQLPIVGLILHHRLLVHYAHILVTIFHEVSQDLEY